MNAAINSATRRPARLLILLALAAGMLAALAGPALAATRTAPRAATHTSANHKPDAKQKPATKHAAKKKPATKRVCTTHKVHGRRVRTCKTVKVKRKPGKRKPVANPTGVSPTATIVQTTTDLKDALTTMPSKLFTSTPAKGAPVITVNPGVRYQTMEGYGAAMTDSSAYLLQNELSPSERDQAFANLFTSHGINLNYVRIPMGASDYTLGDPYSYDDMPAGQSDPSMSNFSIGHDESYIIPALQHMLADNPGVFTPWPTRGQRRRG